MSSKNNFSETATQRYALALYELAKEDSELNRIELESKKIQDLLKIFDFNNMIKDPTYNKNEQLEVLKIIVKKLEFSETLKKFLFFLCFKRRLFFLEKILNSFARILSKNRKEINATLSSSKELSQSEIENIQKELSENFTSKIKLDYTYDPTLIGGLIIQVGSIMIDTSIKNRLKQLETNMLEV